MLRNKKIRAFRAVFFSNMPKAASICAGFMYNIHMDIQKIITYLILITGCAYSAVALEVIRRDSWELKNDRTPLPILIVVEAIVYFCCAMGMSDYTLNTIAIRQLRITDVKHQPGTLMIGGMLPGTIVAFFYLKAQSGVDVSTMLLCAGAIMCGAAAGSRLVARLDGAVIKKIMTVLLTVTFAVIIIRTVMNSGASGTETKLAGSKLLLAVSCCFFFGLINVFGIPMKPMATALFLLLGLTPITTITLIVVIAMFSAFGGSYSMLKNALFHKKMVLVATTVGTAAALAGCLLAVSISSKALNIILIVIMAAAILSMLKKD